MPDSAQASGKTGSCSDSGERLGWFVSYVDQPDLKLVLVILMRGHAHAVRGPMAAGIAGHIYHQLHAEEYYIKEDSEPVTPELAITSAQ
jgi:beta-lactamase class D